MLVLACLCSCMHVPDPRAWSTAAGRSHQLSLHFKRSLPSLLLLLMMSAGTQVCAACAAAVEAAWADSSRHVLPKGEATAARRSRERAALRVLSIRPVRLTVLWSGPAIPLSAGV